MCVIWASTYAPQLNNQHDNIKQRKNIASEFSCSGMYKFRQHNHALLFITWNIDTETSGNDK